MMDHHRLHPINTQAFGDLLQAVRANDVKSVTDLVRVIDPKTNSSKALRLAAELGHVECLNILLPLSEPKAKNSHALLAAAQKGHAECVRLLLPHSNAQARDRRALVAAVTNGHANVVSELIAHDPSDLQIDRNLLYRVVLNQHAAVWRVLLLVLAPQHAPAVVEDLFRVCANRGNIEMMQAVLDQHPRTPMSAELLFDLLVNDAPPPVVDFVFEKMSDEEIGKTFDILQTSERSYYVASGSAQYFFKLKKMHDDKRALSQSLAIDQWPNAPKSKM